MSGLVAAYDSSDDEAQTVPSTATSKLSSTTAVVGADEDDESDDERLEAQARTDAFGLSEANGSSAVQKRKDANGKLVVASAPDVLREVCRMIGQTDRERFLQTGSESCVFCDYC